MNWQAIGAVGEILGAIAVFVTLVYLALQIRQNTKVTNAGTSSYINDALARIHGAIRSNGEFADIWLRGCRDLDALSETDRVRFINHLLEMLNLAEYIHLLERQQLAGTHIDYLPWIATLYRDNPGIKAFMDSMDYVGNPELFERLTNIGAARGTNIF